jgi:hypothetical protein
MEHVHLGRLPATRQWQQVLRLTFEQIARWAQDAAGIRLDPKQGTLAPYGQSRFATRSRQLEAGTAIEADAVATPTMMAASWRSSFF